MTIKKKMKKTWYFVPNVKGSEREIRKISEKSCQRFEVFFVANTTKSISLEIGVSKGKIAWFAEIIDNNV